MRRLAVLSLAPMAAMVVGLAGCAANGGGTPSAGGTSPAGAAVPASPSTRASVPVTADTRQVCDTINRAIAEGAAAFGGDLGTLAGHLTGGNKAAADKARTSAQGRLRTLATKIRTAAGPADDSEVRAAARHTADQITTLATDPALLSGVRSASDLAPVIEKLTRATDEMNKVCV
ncbi:MAG: hypothetical protein V7603_1120 [Micromonosporaceae bacterium]